MTETRADSGASTPRSPRPPRPVWALHHIDWLEELSDAERDRLKSASTIREFAPGETIFSPTPTPHSVYLLERGRVRIYRLSENGGETTFGYVTRGEVFGELTALGDYARESFAQAAEPSRAWRIPREAFQEVIAARPQLVLEVGRQIGERLKRIESRVENLVFRDVRSRVAHMLLELAQDFGTPTNDGAGIVLDVQITQAELATLVGSTRQSVNATLGELEHEGLVVRSSRRLVLPAPEALRRAARCTEARPRNGS